MTLDPLDVDCPDCHASPGVSCFGEQTHAARADVARVRSTMRHGTCTAPTTTGLPCGRPLTAYQAADGTWVAVHPDPDDAAACPPMPDPSRDWNSYAAAVNQGLSSGRPGIEHFHPYCDTHTIPPDTLADPTTSAWECSTCHQTVPRPREDAPGTPNGPRHD